MPLRTTVIGSFPKPDYLRMPDWFPCSAERPTVEGSVKYDVAKTTEFIQQTDHKAMSEEVRRATSDVVSQQVALGIDVITDGEVRRENYVFDFCRHLKGFDFEKPQKTVGREGAVTWIVPVIADDICSRDTESWCAREWKETQALTSSPVKYTIPGPMTIADTTFNAHYTDHQTLLRDLAVCVNREVRALAAAGCKHIQVDEPVMMRKPQEALDFGIDILTECFKGVGPTAQKIVHLCCGYPERLDQKDYKKADKDCYLRLAEKLDASGLDAFSIEDAHRHNDLSLLTKFTKTSVILGVVAIARSRVETVDEIRARAKEALRHIPPERLILAPDCGLGFLPLPILNQKIANMVQAAKALP